MAEPKNDDFLDDIEAAEAEAFAEDAAEIDEEALEIEQVRAERDELKDRFMRALADAENARKRSERDRREAEQYGGSKLSRDMLPVYAHSLFSFLSYFFPVFFLPPSPRFFLLLLLLF